LDLPDWNHRNSSGDDEGGNTEDVDEGGNSNADVDEDSNSDEVDDGSDSDEVGEGSGGDEDCDDDQEEDGELPVGYLIRRRVSMTFNEEKGEDKPIFESPATLSPATKAGELLAHLAELERLPNVVPKGGEPADKPSFESPATKATSEREAPGFESPATKAEDFLAHLAELERKPSVVPPGSSASVGRTHLGSSEFEEEVHTRVAAGE
jgi:hypothetical protein